MVLSDARKVELVLKREKGGDGFYRMIGLPRPRFIIPGPAGLLVQIQPTQPNFSDECCASSFSFVPKQRLPCTNGEATVCSASPKAIQRSSVVERSAVNLFRQFSLVRHAAVVIEAHWGFS